MRRLDLRHTRAIPSDGRCRKRVPIVGRGKRRCVIRRRTSDRHPSRHPNQRRQPRHHPSRRHLQRPRRHHHRPAADLNLGIQTFVNGAAMSPVQIDTRRRNRHHPLRRHRPKRSHLNLNPTVIVEAPSIVPVRRHINYGRNQLRTAPRPLNDRAADFRWPDLHLHERRRRRRQPLHRIPRPPRTANQLRARMADGMWFFESALPPAIPLCANSQRIATSNSS